MVYIVHGDTVVQIHLERVKKCLIGGAVTKQLAVAVENRHALQRQ